MTKEFFDRAVRVFGENSDLILIAYSFYKQYRRSMHRDIDEWGMGVHDDIEDCLKEVHRNMDSQMFCRHFRYVPIYAQGFAYQGIKDETYWKLREHEYQFNEERTPAIKGLKGQKTELKRLEGEELDYAMSHWFVDTLSPEQQFLLLRALVYNENIHCTLSESQVYEYLCQVRSDQRIEVGDNATATNEAYLIKKDGGIVKDFGVSFDREKAEDWAKKFGGKVSECSVSCEIWLGAGKRFV